MADYDSIIMTISEIESFYSGLNATSKICPLLNGILVFSKEEEMQVTFHTGTINSIAPYVLKEYENGYKEYSITMSINELMVPAGTLYTSASLYEAGLYLLPLPFNNAPALAISYTQSLGNEYILVTSSYRSLDSKLTLPNIKLQSTSDRDAIGTLTFILRGF